MRCLFRIAQKVLQPVIARILNFSIQLMCNSLKSGKRNNGGVGVPGLQTVANRFAGSLKLPKGKSLPLMERWWKIKKE